MRMEEILKDLGGGKRARISFAGAGGKTSCILALARSQAFLGERVLICTSTHMEAPEVLRTRGRIGGSREETWEELERQGWLMGGRSCGEPGKIRGFSQEDWTWLEKRGGQILIEADGSRKFPVKVPKEGEPVIYPETTHIFILAGASALGRPIEQVCHRQEEARRILERENRALSERLTPELLGRLLEEGYIKPLKKQYPGRTLAVLLNQADLLARPEETRKALSGQVSVPVYLHSRREELQIQAVFLAAGFSKRFGENKLLYEFQGKPLYRHTLDCLRELLADGSLQGLTVVTRYPKIAGELESLGVSWTENPHSERGISSSLKLGLLKAIEGQDKTKEAYYMFFTADQPFLKKETLRQFLFSYLESKKGIGCPVRGRETGSPVIFHETYVPRLLELEGDRGGKQVVKRNEEDVFFFPFPPAELEDLDRKEDLEKR